MKEQSFEQQVERLESIVKKLEQGDVALQDSMALFEEGTKLIASCQKMLDEAEQKVTVLKETISGPKEVPFEGGEKE